MKLVGSGAGEHPEIIWDPYIFLQPLKLSTSNLVQNLGLGLAYQKTMFRTKIGGGLGQGSIQKNLGIPYIFLSMHSIGQGVKVLRLRDKGVKVKGG